MKEIGPGEGVAAFRLPLPINGVALINDMIERVYGTGEAMLSFNGDSIQVSAPATGFGPVKTARRKTPRQKEGGRLVHASVREGRAQVTIEEADDVVLAIMDAVRIWFEGLGGINYVEFGLQAPDGERRPFVFCVQRADGQTPHALREAAEAEVERLRLALKEAQRR